MTMPGADSFSDDVRRLLSGTLPAAACLEWDARTCAGAVEHRMALSSTGISYPRCDTHWGQRLQAQERIASAYPDSPMPPAWYDPLAAGEAWEDD